MPTSSLPKAVRKARREAAVEHLEELNDELAEKRKAVKKAAKEAAKSKPSALLVDVVAGEGPAGVKVDDGAVDLSAVSPDSTPGFEGSKKDAAVALALGERVLSELQDRLYAQSRADAATGSVLLVLQGMDTSGKGGIVRHVVGAMDPQGVRITGFKAPTDEEKKHDFLWRIKPHLPAPGQIAVFDRSHYEDVLIHRVRGWAAEAEIKRRYEAINAFEAEAAAQGTRIIKVMLHISHEEQGERLLERLNRPEKHWKYNAGDIDERKLWDDYQDAYAKAIEATSSPEAPWHVVPANHKWYARLAVADLLIAALRDIDPVWPKTSLNVGAERARLAATRD
ncbi:PPK2 family polyphosphate kinase [Falsarthrobacter nasiphocae]|uniref:PPK2 family polyphosphate:nucleotide phosphotransferase n=1 Tax=Falsarthrobacter nasiphocae TaxID=189863 RepID=A0AAE3YG15_9MICC|nr:PPK2 family polyphosphate kinase [Falsarthrobacter nasiphocae]MDR6891567.1 PPK2 family polyphosphate:nucleotide phosphotransferase [Falsarthrobacter nasiphocae]